MLAPAIQKLQIKSKNATFGGLHLKEHNICSLLKRDLGDHYSIKDKFEDKALLQYLGISGLA